MSLTSDASVKCDLTDATTSTRSASKKRPYIEVSDSGTDASHSLTPVSKQSCPKAAQIDASKDQTVFFLDDSPVALSEKCHLVIQHATVAHVYGLPSGVERLTERLQSLTVLLQERYHELMTHTMDRSGHVSLVDLLFVAWAHLYYAAHKELWSKRPPTFEDCHELQAQMRFLMRKWSDPELHRDSGETWISLSNNVVVAIVSTLSTFVDTREGNEDEFDNRLAILSTDEPDGAQTRYNDIDESDLRHTVSSDEEDEEEETKSDGNGKEPTKASLCPFRFIEIYGRLWFEVSQHAQFFTCHRMFVPPSATLECSDLDEVTNMLLDFDPTPRMEETFMQLMCMSSSPLGSNTIIRRFHPKSWHLIEPAVVCRSELGNHDSSLVVNTRSKGPRMYLNKPTEGPHEQWALELWHVLGFARLWASATRDPGGLSFLHHHLVMTHHLLTRKGVWKARQDMGRPRRPILCHVHGQWMVQFPMKKPSKHRKFALVQCPDGVRQALVVLCYIMIQSPYHTKTSQGKTMTNLVHKILEVAGVSQCV